MRHYHLRYTLIGVAIYSLIYGHITYADDYFDPNLVEGINEKYQHIDLSVFSKVGGQTVGAYDTNIYLNNTFVSNEVVHYDHIHDPNKLSPVLTKADYIRFGVRENATPDFMRLHNEQAINTIGDSLPDAFVNYDFQQKRLNISIPQLYVNNVAQGYISPEKWDDGLPALFTNYNYSGSTVKYDHQSGKDQSMFLSLRSGANLGAWRFRNYSTYSHINHTDKWKSINTYVERDIKSLQSRLVGGDHYTPSEMFDSFSFRGVQLSSDDSMLPASLRGFAPVIKGIAQTNAQITIKQGGNIIWQSYVPPGPFSISDLYPTSASGDLEVTIKETDGSVRTYIQPFSSVPMMLREGRFKYSVTAGKYRSTLDKQKQPNFIQLTAAYGLPYTSTLYGGTILAKDYKSILVGVGKDIGFLGSLSLDATYANAKIEDKSLSGGSFRFQYSKDFLTTGTNFSLAGYRYSTANYRDFAEVNGYYADNPHNDHGYTIWRNHQSKRSKVQLNLNQSLGDFGSIYISGYQQQYWHVKGKEQSLNLGYNKNYLGVNYTLNYNYSRDMYYDQTNKNLSFSVQIPLSLFDSNTWLNTAVSSDMHGRSNSSIGISGSTLENTLNYNVQQSYANRGTGGSGSASVDYDASFGEYQLGYNYTRDTQQINYSAMGGVLIHPYGISLSQPLGDTMGLVHTKDVAGVKVINNTGIYTDWQGNSIVPYLTPYQQNLLSLDPTTLKANADILTTMQTVVPTRGALVLANYPTRIGYKVLLTLTKSNIPFGAKAVVSVDNEVVSEGIVAEKQRVYLSGVPAQGVVDVSWSGGQCAAPFKLIESDDQLISLTTVCE